MYLTGGRGIDQVGGFGYTPLSIACRYGHLEMVATLIDHGADPNFETIRGRYDRLGM